MRKTLLGLALFVSAACLADVVIRNAGTRVGQTSTLNCEKDGGLVCQVDGGIGVALCNPASALDKGCVIPGPQVFGTGGKTFNGVVSAPVLDAGAATIYGIMSAQYVLASTTATDTAAIVGGVGTATGALTALSSGAGKYAFQSGYYGTCCPTPVCGCTGGARTLTIDGAGNIVTAGNITATGTITATGAITGSAAITTSGTIGSATQSVSAGVLQAAGLFALTSYTDDSATPGSRTVNKVCGKSSIASGAKTATITNAVVTANSRVFTQLEFVDATCLYVQAAIPAAGSFALTLGPANCTLATKLSWCVVN